MRDDGVLGSDVVGQPLPDEVVRLQIELPKRGALGCRHPKITVRGPDADWKLVQHETKLLASFLPGPRDRGSLDGTADCSNQRRRIELVLVHIAMDSVLECTELEGLVLLSRQDDDRYTRCSGGHPLEGADPAAVW